MRGPQGFNMRPGRLPVTAALAVLVLATASAAAAGPDAYFPMTTGASWTYRTADGPMMVMRVGAESNVGGQRCRLLETVIDGAVTKAECYAAAADGVYVYQRRYPAGAVVLEPPQRVMAAPVRVGLRWEWHGRFGDQAVVLQYTWARRESVVVPAGTFDGMQLYFAGALGPGTQIQSWRWFARGVGMVKEDSLVRQGGQTLRVYAELVRLVPPR